MNGIPSPDERARLRWCRIVTWLSPIGAAVSATLGMAALTYAGANGNAAYVVSYAINALIGGAAAAASVIHLHPVEHGRWWRAGLAFLVGAAATWTFAVMLIVLLFVIVGTG